MADGVLCHWIELIVLWLHQCIYAFIGEIIIDYFMGILFACAYELCDMRISATHHTSHDAMISEIAAASDRIGNVYKC